MNYKDEIEQNFKDGVELSQIVRSYYLVYPTCAFEGAYRIADEILNEVSNFFSIPVNDILVCGSAKLGISPIKQTAFTKGKSDLDLAILNKKCYFEIFDEILEETRNYSKKHLFGNKYNQYISSVSKGMINYKFLPNSKRKKDLNTFFNELSIKHRGFFSNISCCFYASEYSFKQKQIHGLAQWKSNILI